MTEELLSHAEYMELEGADPRFKHGRRVFGCDLLELILLVSMLILVSLWVLIGVVIVAVA